MRTEIEEKMDFISDAERKFEEMMKDDVLRLMSEYKEKFGGFTQHDCWLWGNCRMNWVIVYNAGDILDEVDDDDDRMDPTRPLRAKA